MIDKADQQLAPIGSAMLANWRAQQAIRAKIDADEYTTESEIDAAAEWPA